MVQTQYVFLTCPMTKLTDDHVRWNHRFLRFATAISIRRSELGARTPSLSVPSRFHTKRRSVKTFSMTSKAGFSFSAW
jgi:hypothetical protein